MANPLASTHVEVRIRILSDDTSQPAYVRNDVTVETLIQETLAEFTKEKELNENSDYVLSWNKRILAPEDVVADLGISPPDELVLGYMQFARPAEAEPEPKPQPTGPEKRRLVLVHEGVPRATFRVENFPALIGRPSQAGETSTEMLAVDLSGFEEKGKRTVSRRHGRVILLDGQPAVETINPNNPVTVMGQPVEAGLPRVLADGDLIRFGNVYLRATFE